MYGLDFLAVRKLGHEQNMEQGERRKEALAEKPSDFESLVGSNMACDCLS